MQRAKHGWRMGCGGEGGVGGGDHPGIPVNGCSARRHAVTASGELFEC